VKFKIDENLPVEFIDLLKKEGWRAYSVFEEELGGARDEAIFNRCKKENLILLTLDLDFANILKYPPEESPGIIVFRPSRQDKIHLMEMLTEILPSLKKHPPAKKLWIVEEKRIRIYK